MLNEVPPPRDYAAEADLVRQKVKELNDAIRAATSHRSAVSLGLTVRLDVVEDHRIQGDTLPILIVKIFQKV